MPIFEYVCEDCGRTFEKLLRSEDWNLSQQCAHCESKKVKKRFSSFGVGSSQDNKPCGAPGAAPCSGCCGHS